jgi:hypothetical protein
MRAMRMLIFAFFFACVATVAAKPKLAKQGEACAGGKCARGLTCVKYRGIAGASGPEFSSCEIRCTKNSKCPKGQSCITIADGPGQVCRPDEKKPAPAPPSDETKPQP